MHWKKRNRRRKIAHSHGYTHWRNWNNYVKASVHFFRYQYLLESWCSRDVKHILYELNTTVTLLGCPPEHCLTEEQFWEKYREQLNEFITAQEEYEDECIMRFLDEEFEKREQNEFDGDTIDVIPINHRAHVPTSDNEPFYKSVLYRSAYGYK